jgi:hypothetical protein
VISDRKILPREGEAPAEPNTPHQPTHHHSGGRGSRRAEQPHKPTHHHSGGRGSRRAETTPQANSPPLGRARLLPSRNNPTSQLTTTREGEAPAEPNVPTSQLTTTREGEAPAEPDVSVQFSVFSNRKIPLRGRHHHKKRSFFRVIPRHSAAIVSRQDEIPHKTMTSAGSAGASPSQRRPPRTLRPTTATTTHSTRSIFRVIPRHSAAIVSRRGETPQNTLNFPRHSAAIVSHRVEIPHKTTTSAARQEPRPPKDASPSQDTSPSQGGLHRD